MTRVGSQRHRKTKKKTSEGQFVSAIQASMLEVMKFTSLYTSSL